MKYKSYREIPVWKLSHQLAIRTYQITSQFPQHELYCLVSQLRRAIVSVPSNIVEGVNRKNTKELIQFLSIARGSLMEADYQLLLSYELKYISKVEYDSISQAVSEVLKQLNFWKFHLKKKGTSDATSN